jgi:hypothetical protein
MRTSLHFAEGRGYLSGGRRCTGRLRGITLIFLSGDCVATDEADQFAKARKKVAELGGTGIDFSEMKEPKDRAKVAGFIFGTSANLLVEI